MADSKLLHMILITMTNTKKKVLRNTLHFSFFSPRFLGGAWRVSKTRQIALQCKQENYSQIPEKPQDRSSSVNYKSNGEVLKIH